MMKKLLLVLGILMFSAGSVFAYSMPRWSALPLSVYLPAGTPESLIVKSAFEEWKANSKNIARFIYRQSSVAQKTSNVNVIFYDKLPNGDPYQLQKTYVSTWTYTPGKPTGYFFHIDMMIALNDNDGKPYSRSELKAIALRAVGETLGVKCGAVQDGVMACKESFEDDAVTDEDAQALYRVYKRVNKSEMEKYNK